MRKRQRLSPQVSEADRELFEQAIGPVRRMQPVEEPALQRPQPEPEPRQFELDEARVLDELLTMSIDPAEIEIGDELSYLRDGFRPELLKRLKRGSFSVQDEIDLHQMTAEVARSAVVTFLAEAHRRGLHCIKLIHGKGLRSKAGGPVIKRLVDKMLRQRDDVVAFASARSEQGGTGAAVVLLRHKQKG